MSRSGTLEHVLFEGGTYGFDLVAEVTYSVESASGDGWHEPHIPAHFIIEDVRLFKRIRGRRPVAFGSYEHEDFTQEQTIEEPAPVWVYELLDQQDWQDAIPEDDCDWDAMPGGHDWLRDREMGAN